MNQTERRRPELLTRQTVQRGSTATSPRNSQQRRPPAHSASWDDGQTPSGAASSGRRGRRARCVPDRPVNAGNSRSLPDSPIHLRTARYTLPPRPGSYQRDRGERQGSVPDHATLVENKSYHDISWKGEAASKENIMPRNQRPSPQPRPSPDVMSEYPYGAAPRGQRPSPQPRPSPDVMSAYPFGSPPRGPGQLATG